MRRVLLVLLALAFLVLAACGDDEESPRDGAGAETAPAETTPGETQQDGQAEGCRSVPQPDPREQGDRAAPRFRVDRSKAYTAVVETNCGTLEIQLAASRAPRTVSSFVALAREGFYDGLGFHRVVPGFVVQGGDPAGSGTGGAGYEVVEPPPRDLTYDRGTVAMAKAGTDAPGTSGSQFFIVTAEDAGLEPEYALLGRLVRGADVLARIETVPIDPSDERPEEPVVMQRVTVRESG
jgi:peptidyl-prolyl cis-trans isomerase B (cyclophilin B)